MYIEPLYATAGVGSRGGVPPNLLYIYTINYAFEYEQIQRSAENFSNPLFSGGAQFLKKISKIRRRVPLLRLFILKSVIDSF